MLISPALVHDRRCVRRDADPFPGLEEPGIHELLAPRIGFAYQVTPKFVARGGFGLFYNGFENRGYFPNLGENLGTFPDVRFRAEADAGGVPDTPARASGV